MSAPYIIPFNHQPAATYQGTGAGTLYTVPSGKYARVTLTAFASFTLATGGGDTMQPNGNTNSISLWIKTGDVVGATIANSSGGNVNNATFQGYNTNASGSINGTVVVRSTANGHFYNNSGGIINVTLTNQNDFYYHVEEYNVIS
jgi:hypothetical protein